MQAVPLRCPTGPSRKRLRVSHHLGSDIHDANVADMGNAVRLDDSQSPWRDLAAKSRHDGKRDGRI